jgi:hypothetical protein
MPVEIRGCAGRAAAAARASIRPPRWSTVRRVSMQISQSIRRGWSRRGAARRLAALVAVLAVCAIAIPVLALAGTPGVGYDVSFPQCSGSGVATLPASPSLAVVGVNDGRPFTSNPCLVAELKWAGAGAQVYLNADDPGPSVRVRRGRLVQLKTHWPTTAQLAPKRCVRTGPHGTTATAPCAYDYGWSAAKDAYGRVAAAMRVLVAGNPPPGTLPVTPLRWWLDVESANVWLRGTALNTAAINGFLGYLQSVHAASVGIYSNRFDAHAIFTPASRFAPGTERWLATGSGTLAGGLSYCGYPGFVGDTLSMVQYWPSSLDADAPCVGYITGALDPAAGVPATMAVTLSHPAPAGGAQLTLSSSSAGGRFTGPGQTVPAATLALDIPAGANKSAAFAYTDTRVGTPTLTALGTLGRIANFASVTPGPLYGIVITPNQLTVPVGAAVTLTATGYDRYGNRIPRAVAPTWSASPGVAATLTRGPARTVTLRAMAAAPVSVTAALGAVSGSRTYTITVPAGGTPGTISGSARLVAGMASGPQRVRIWTPAGPGGSVWTLVPASPTGLIATGPNGPWVRTLTETVGPGAIFSPAFYLRETAAGTTAITATQGGLVITRPETVAAGAAVRLAIAPGSVRLGVGASLVLRARAGDAYGNIAPAVVRWSVSPAADVRLSSRHTAAVVIRGVRPGSAAVVITLGRLSARASVTVP